jgi:hypothetical protein
MEINKQGASAPGGRQATVPTLKESGFSKQPYVHTNLNNHPVTFFWWAKTPTGRESIYWQAFTFFRTKTCGKLKRSASGWLNQIQVPSRHFDTSTMELYEEAKRRSYALLPAVPKGYEWQGPFLYSEIKPPTQEDDMFAFKEPEKCDGTPLVYLATVAEKGEIAIQLAQKILIERGVQA